MSKCEYCEITFHIQFTQLKYYLLLLLLVQYIYIFSFFHKFMFSIPVLTYYSFFVLQLEYNISR